VRKREAGLIADGGNLFLVDGSNWQFIYERNGRRRFMGFGPANVVTLAKARSRAAEARLLLIDDRDPLAERRASRAAAAKPVMTFSECATQFHKANAPGWRSPKHAAEWRSTIDAYAAPIIGHLSVNVITVEHVLQVLADLWVSKPDVASRLRGRVESVLDWAKVRGLRSGENPARWRGHLDHLLPARSKVVKIAHHAALDHREVAAFVMILRTRSGVPSRALEFTILTASRSGEAMRARWNEIDLGQKLWTIPASRTKTGREHRVPLSDRALEIIAEMSAMRSNDFLFPGQKYGQPLGATTLFDLLRQLRRGDLTAHGFRSTFRDWAGDHGHPRELAEAALAHVTGDATERAYARSDALARRRVVMQQWSNYCDGQAGGNVVSLSAR
jgi:integrase